MEVVLEGFMSVSNITQNDVTRWKCEEHLKCKSCVLSSAEKDSLMKAPSEHKSFYKELPWSSCTQLMI